MIKPFQLILLLFGIAIVAISGCVHDPLLPESYSSNEPIFTGDCNSDTIYYNRDIAPILNANCATSNCHNSTTAKDGVDLSSYTQVIKTGGIKPYDAPDSELIKVLYESGEDQMPPLPSSHLPSDVIAVLEKWINQGAMNLDCEEINVICDSLNVSYVSDIVKILNTSCVGCHSLPSPGGGVLLDSYSSVKVQVVNGKLMGTIEHKLGFKPMPQGGGKLDDCSISKLNSWIADGALDN